MYDKYFSPDELARLPMYTRSPEGDADWIALIGQVRQQMEQGAAPEDAGPRELAERWMTLLLRDTNGDPRLLVKLNQMHEQEPAMQAHIGISPAMRDYVLRAFSEGKLRCYEKYLTADEARFMRAHYYDRIGEWPPLIAQVRDASDAGQAPDSALGRELARQWMALFCSYAGNDPATHAKFRQALMTDPELTAGTWADDATLSFMRRAMGALAAALAPFDARRRQRGERDDEAVQDSCCVPPGRQGVVAGRSGGGLDCRAGRTCRRVSDAADQADRAVRGGRRQRRDCASAGAVAIRWSEAARGGREPSRGGWQAGRGAGPAGRPGRLHLDLDFQ
ncbi:hypothetical protein G6F22_014618 [Rhizopus arrhizus]|nr:hypothetical protein G6F22_014618 [Rhizopus arrhizus]